MLGVQWAPKQPVSMEAENKELRNGHIMHHGVEGETERFPKVSDHIEKSFIVLESLEGGEIVIAV